MSDPARFLNTFAQALAAMTLYRDGHPARERAVDAAYSELHDLQADTARPLFTFLGDEVVFGRLPLRELKAWDWGQRLAHAGIQRLEFEDRVSRGEFEAFLEELLARLTLSVIDSSEARQMRRTSIRFGAVGLKGETERAPGSLPTATIAFSLGEEAETLRWVHQEVQTRGTVPLLEAEAVVRSLAVAMHGGQHLVLPLLQLKEFDQYTTTHSMNVAVLAMALAEFLALGASDVRTFGVAGLLHDVGKIKIPIEVLTKPGKLTDDERALMNDHPAAGARILLDTEENLDLAIVVAYEHHIMLNGGGYPVLHYPRPCHRASTLVHVCDVYDALRTRRPYRDAWPVAKVLAYLEERAGLEFDPDLVSAFVRMMRQWEPQVAVLADEHAAVPASQGA
ncbi:MAG TPA: HD domain-containing phosphohydrolase [Gemmatimonadales bacterium]|jgi:putative nucleotidyltransferase with HDIG domain|nr:HD domain-containing phosphohydrolase [Gemmatimonadales bacterium]